MIKRKITKLGVMPRGYGLAWYEDYGFLRVCYPIPLNVVVRLLRVFYYWLQEIFGLPNNDIR